MYFDNFHKNNSTYSNLNFQTNLPSGYSSHLTQNIEHTPPNNKAYFNSKYGEFTSDNRVIPVRNIPQTYNPVKNNPGTQVGYVPAYMNTVNNTQSQINNTSFNQDIPSIPYPSQNNQFINRRDSISYNNYHKSNQTHSPSGKNIFIQNNFSNQFNKANFGIQTIKNYNHQQEVSTNQNFNTGTTIKNIQQNNQVLGNKTAKNLSQQKFLHKIGHYKQNNIDNNYFIAQQKINTKCNTQYSSIYPNNSKKQKDQQMQKKSKQNYRTNKDFNKNTKNIDYNSNELPFYNFQLKNIQTDFTSKINQKQYGQFKYYTPSLLKQKQENLDKTNFAVNQFSRISQKRDSQKQQLFFTDRDIFKSPSHNDLFQSVYNDKEIVKNKAQFNNNSTINLNQKSRKNSESSKNASQTTIGNMTLNINPQQLNNLNPVNYDPSQKNSVPTNKHYHALIQNLQKKFSQQKKSSQNFQVKEKFYINEISKKEEKIKRLENIIQNNRQMVITKDQIIKQLRTKIQTQMTSSPATLKKQQLSNTADSAQLKDLQIQELKRQTTKYKEQIKKLKKKINQNSSFNGQNFQKQQKNKLQQKIKQLEKQIHQMKQQKESFALQISKLRQSNSNLHQQYNIQIKQHQKIKEENINLKKSKESLQDNLKNIKISTTELQIKYNHAKQETNKLKQKYQTVLTAISSQKSLTGQQLQIKLQSQRKKLKQIYQLEKKELSLTLRQQLQRLKIKLERYEAQVNFKNAKIKDLEQKLSKQQVKNASSQLTENSESQINFQKPKSQVNQKYLEQITLLKQKLKNKEEINQTFVQQLKNKTQIFQRMEFEKELRENKIQKIQNKLKSLKQIKSDNKKLENKDAQIKDFKSCSQYSEPSNQKIQSINFQQLKLLLQAYHTNYKQLALLFNFSQKQKQKSSEQPSSLTSIPFQDVQQNQSSTQNQKALPPSKQYLQIIHPLIKDEIQKILKDIKKLVQVLKQNQNQIQQKNQKFYEMDKTIKKQLGKINSLIAQIHMKNVTIVEINKMQIQKDIVRLNQKYQILMNVGFTHEIQ